VKKSGGNENKRRKKSREEMKTIGDMEKKERKIAMQERKYFVCRCFGHITYHCRNREKIEESRSVTIQMSKLKAVDSIYFLFLFSFSFSF